MADSRARELETAILEVLEDLDGCCLDDEGDRERVKQALLERLRHSPSNVRVEVICCGCGKVYDRTPEDVRVSANGVLAISLDCGLVPLSTVEVRIPSKCPNGHAYRECHEHFDYVAGRRYNATWCSEGCHPCPTCTEIWSV